MNIHKSIIYINYSPYENSGKILDYLLENFDHVFLLALGFHNIKKKTRLNQLLVFSKRKLIKKYSLIRFPSTKHLIFFLLPFTSLINFIQILFYMYFLKKQYGKIGVYFTVNGFTAWIGNMAKKLNLVEKTVFWVWDYYPPVHENKVIMFMRYIYLFFDKVSLRSDKVVFINNKILNLRRSTGILPESKHFPVVPIGTDSFTNITTKSVKNPILGFIGVIKKSQGLSEVFDGADYIVKKFPGAKFEIIGSGPDEEYFKSIAVHSPLLATFHGYLEGESFNSVLKKCTIGIATYLPDSSNVSHFGDPGKVKRYLSLGLPVIITDIFEFSQEIERSKAGVIIKSGKPEEFVKAIEKIMGGYKNYQANALNLAKKYYYKKIYPEMFDFSQTTYCP